MKARTIAFILCLLAMGWVCISNAQTNCNTQTVKFVGAKRVGSGSTITVGTQYRYYNVATDNISNTQVNAVITVSAISNATIATIDNDGADSDGQDRKNLFAPQISPNSELNSSDKIGYADFTITFYKNKNNNSNDNQNYSELISLKDLNYVHYDIDGSAVTTGSQNSRYEFREFGQVDVTIPGVDIFSNSPTELSVNNSGVWKGYKGSTIEKAGISTAPEVVAAFKFNGDRTSITVRMGYDYKYLGTGNNNNSGWNTTPTREFGTTFSCFKFPNMVYLPVKWTVIKTTVSNE